MLEGISSREFFSYLIGILLLYYLCLFIRFGKVKLFSPKRQGKSFPGSAGSGKRKWQVIENNTGNEEKPVKEKTAENPTSDTENEQRFEPEEPAEAEKEFAALETLAGELEEIISATAANTEKQTLLDRIQREIARYPTLHNHQPYRVAINNLIIRQAGQYCNITITKEEAESFWRIAEGVMQESH